MKTKVEKLTTMPCEIEITGATLLTVDEAEQLLTAKDRACGSWWWLRATGHNQRGAAIVFYGGTIYAGGGFKYYDDAGVRPALKIKNLASANLEIGDEFYIGEQRFKIISDHLAHCDLIVGYSQFDSKGNDYENSEIKAYVDHWFDELMNRGTDA